MAVGRAALQGQKRDGAQQDHLWREQGHAPHAPRWTWPDLPALQPLAIPAPSTSMLLATEELHRLGTEALRLVGH